MAEMKWFGKSSIGTNDVYFGDDRILGSSFKAEYTGEIESMSIYILSPSYMGAVYWKCAIYGRGGNILGDASPMTFLAETETKDIRTNDVWQWHTLKFLTEHRVVENKWYELLTWCDGAANWVGTMKFTSTGNGGYLNETWGAWPTTLGDIENQSRTYTVGVNYEPSSSLHVDLGGEGSLFEVTAAPAGTQCRPGKFGGYSGMGKLHLGGHRSRVH